MTSPARSLVSVARPLPAKRPSMPLAAVERMLPVARRTVAVAAASFAAEYVLRALANRALGQVIKRNASSTTRTIVTEFVVIERMRRL